jgi:hypothetical protein
MRVQHGRSTTERNARFTSESTNEWYSNRSSLQATVSVSSVIVASEQSPSKSPMTFHLNATSGEKVESSTDYDARNVKGEHEPKDEGVATNLESAH